MKEGNLNKKWAFEMLTVWICGGFGLLINIHNSISLFLKIISMTWTMLQGAKTDSSLGTLFIKCIYVYFKVKVGIGYPVKWLKSMFMWLSNHYHTEDATEEKITCLTISRFDECGFSKVSEFWNSLCLPRKIVAS